MPKRNTDGLRVGNPGNKGGGRPPDWLKAECQKIVVEEKVIRFLADVVSGKEITKTDVYNLRGDKIGHSETSAPPKCRVDAAKELLDRGFGKAVQHVESESLVEIFRQELKGRYK